MSKVGESSKPRNGRRRQTITITEPNTCSIDPSIPSQLGNFLDGRMRVVALVSGGKDSCYALQQCLQNGHTVVCIANLHPPLTAPSDEMDSFMYQTVGHDLVEAYAECTGIPLIRGEIRGKPIRQDLDYSVGASIQGTKGEDEVEDLFNLLARAKALFPDIEAVCSGAILSNYQRLRVENVCSRLNLVSLAYLWQRDQRELLDEMIAFGIHAVLVKTAAMGLHPQKHLGKSIEELRPLFVQLEQMYGCNVCGEGGEYETITLDCPLFRKRIVIDESEVVMHSNDAFAPVGFLKVRRFHLVDKQRDTSLSSDIVSTSVADRRT